MAAPTFINPENVTAEYDDMLSPQDAKKAPQLVESKAAKARHLEDPLSAENSFIEAPSPIKAPKAQPVKEYTRAQLQAIDLVMKAAPAAVEAVKLGKAESKRYVPTAAQRDAFRQVASIKSLGDLTEWKAGMMALQKQLERNSYSAKNPRDKRVVDALIGRLRDDVEALGLDDLAPVAKSTVRLGQSAPAG